MENNIDIFKLPGKTLYVPLYVISSNVLPTEGQTVNLSDFQLRNASSTPLVGKCYIEVEILESTTTVARLDDDLDDIGINLSNYLVQIKSVKMHENATKFFVAGSDNLLKNPLKIYAFELPESNHALRKIKLHDTINYGIYKSNKYEFPNTNCEYVVYFPELVVNNINISKLHELQKDNFQIIYQLTPLQIT